MAEKRARESEKGNPDFGGSEIFALGAVVTLSRWHYDGITEDFAITDSPSFTVSLLERTIGLSILGS